MSEQKLTLRQVEIPLNKFNEVAIPYHLNLLQEHRSTIAKSRQKKDWDTVRIEQTKALNVVKQLKQLLYELDVLRNKVQECDIEKFDQRTEKFRNTIRKLLKEYLETLAYQPQIEPIYTENEEEETDNDRILAGVTELQIQKDELAKYEACLNSTELLRNEIQDIYSIFVQLEQLVHEQADDVEQIETNVESAEVNVNNGLQNIKTAARYKASVYPVAGALVGTCLGGPIGFFAGLKLGGLAALSCGLMGFAGGQILKKHHVHGADEQRTIQEETKEHIS